MIVIKTNGVYILSLSKYVAFQPGSLISFALSPALSLFNLIPAAEKNKNLAKNSRKKLNFREANAYIIRN